MAWHGRVAGSIPWYTTCYFLFFLSFFVIFLSFVFVLFFVFVFLLISAFFILFYFFVFFFFLISINHTCIFFLLKSDVCKPAQFQPGMRNGTRDARMPKSKINKLNKPLLCDPKPRHFVFKLATGKIRPTMRQQQYRAAFEELGVGGGELSWSRKKKR